MHGPSFDSEGGEFDFNWEARSHKGAQVLMKLMAETARLHSVSHVDHPDQKYRC